MQMRTSKILIVDNEDSFTYNLAQLLENAGAHVEVRSGRTTLKDNLDTYKGIVFSPGPGIPSDFPAMYEILQSSVRVPILGICLGMQAIALYFEGTLFRQVQVQHGQVHQVEILNENSLLFRNLPQKIEVGLYHSWAVDLLTLPDSLHITCISDQKIIMGLRHKTRWIEGLQFHPESFLTPYGKLIIANWLANLPDGDSTNQEFQPV